MTPNAIEGKFHRGILLPLGLIVGGLAGFAAVAADLVYHGQLVQWDRPLAEFFFKHSQPGGAVHFLCSAFSGLGELWVILMIALAVGIPLALRKKWRSLAAWVTALAGSGIINSALKNYFQVPRPVEFTVYASRLTTGYSFPSGHTMAVSITAGALALVVMRSYPMSAPRRWMVGGLVALVSVMEAFSLLYIGVHWLTDLLAALTVSAAWLGVIRWMLPPAVAGDDPR